MIRALQLIAVGVLLGVLAVLFAIVVLYGSF